MSPTHVGWIFAPDWNEGDPNAAHDLSRYPELRCLEYVHGAPAGKVLAVSVPGDSTIPAPGLERSS